MLLQSKLLFCIFSRLANIVKPDTPKENLPRDFSPHLKLLPKDIIFTYIYDYRKNHSGTLKIFKAKCSELSECRLYFLDIGGRHGEWHHYAKGFEYHILEIDKNTKGPGLIYGDICHCPNIPSETYDVIFSNNVFEHLKEPWAAAEECVRITKKGGLIIHIAPFSWRYHPDPVDYYRYSHDGLKFLFERTGQIETLLVGYDISNRRKDQRGGKIKGRLDVPPIDELGGWREHWLTIFISRKF